MALPGTAGSLTGLTTTPTELLDFSSADYYGASTIEIRVDSGDIDVRVPGLHADDDYVPLLEGECTNFRWGNRAITSCIAKAQSGTADIRAWVSVATRG